MQFLFFCFIFLFFFFFFQAEDGIRDVAVTGVQTCALPIYYLAKARRFLVADDLGRSGRVQDEEPSRLREVIVIRRDPTEERDVLERNLEIGRASCRERAEICVSGVRLKKKRERNRELSDEQ